MHAWNTEGQPGPDDEVVQPKSRPNDLSEDELKGIQQRFEQDIAKDGPGQERALNRSNAEGRSDAEG